MKKTLPAALLLASCTATAQNKAVVNAPAAPNALPAKIADAPTADPKHYTVEFENEDVRVLRIKYPALSKGEMHDHPQSVTVFLTEGELRMTFPDGKSVIGKVPKGVAVFEEAGPHQPENLLNKDFEAVRIELKK